MYKEMEMTTATHVNYHPVKTSFEGVYGHLLCYNDFSLLFAICVLTKLRKIRFSTVPLTR